MRKRRLVIVLVLSSILVFTFMPTAMALTGDTGTDGDFNWQELADGTVEVTSYTGAGGAVEIPDTLSGKSVTAIADAAFANNTAITEITIPDTVTTIGANAFSECSEMVFCSFSVNLTSLGNSAFSFCRKLDNVTLPAGITIIPFRAFASCNSLSSITFEGAITEIGIEALEDCNGFTSFTIPSSITIIGEGALAYCSNLKTVTIPEAVTTLGDRLFRQNENLTTIGIKSMTAVFGSNMFNSTDISSDGIYGYAGSTAEAYASANGYPFTVIAQLDKTELTVSIGDSDTVTASSGGGTWIFDSEYVNVSEDGLTATVTGVKAGTTTVTYRQGGFDHDISVTVEEVVTSEPTPTPSDGQVPNPKTGSGISWGWIMAVSVTLLVFMLIIFTFTRRINKA